jgi:hypothetical protein
MIWQKSRSEKRPLSPFISQPNSNNLTLCPFKSRFRSVITYTFLFLKLSPPYKIYSMYASCSSHLNARFVYSDISHWTKKKNCELFKFLRIPHTFSISDPKILFGTSFKNIHKIACTVTAWRTQVLPTTCVESEPGEHFLCSSLCYDIIILLGRCWLQGSRC